MESCTGTYSTFCVCTCVVLKLINFILFFLIHFILFYLFIFILIFTNLYFYNPVSFFFRFFRFFSIHYFSLKFAVYSFFINLCIYIFYPYSILLSSPLLFSSPLLEQGRAVPNPVFQLSSVSPGGHRNRQEKQRKSHQVN
jgi:hypothetical protein